VRKETGSLIGAVGGLAFLLFNTGSLPAALAWTIRVIGVVAFVAVVWYAVLRPQRRGMVERPGAVNMRTYWLAVLAMVVAIPLGSLVINRVLERPELTLPWVVLVLGAHFLPFARAFRAPIFAQLGLALVALAVAGAVVALLVDARAAVWLAIAAGFVLLGFSLAGGRQRSAIRA
jgi:hypothetical protein